MRGSGLPSTFRSRKPRQHAPVEGYKEVTKRKALSDNISTNHEEIGGEGSTFCSGPEASAQPHTASTPGPLQTANANLSATQPADASPCPVASPRTRAKRQRGQPPSQRQLTLTELAALEMSPGKSTRSVAIAIKQARRAQEDHVHTVPRFAKAATKVMGRIKADLYIKDAQYGRGLFALHGFDEGAIITRYDGIRRVVSDPGFEKISKTHMLRIPQSQNIVDGRPLALQLEKAKDHSGRWWPRKEVDWEAGFGSLANSANTVVANARMVFLPDDRGLDRPSHEKVIPKALRDVLPRVPFLVAKRRIAPNEEILWKYQVAYDSYEAT